MLQSMKLKEHVRKKIHKVAFKIETTLGNQSELLDFLNLHRGIFLTMMESVTSWGAVVQIKLFITKQTLQRFSYQEIHRFYNIDVNQQIDTDRFENLPH